MTRLILTTDYIYCRSDADDSPDLFLHFGHYFGDHLQRLVYGPPPTSVELDDCFDVRSEQRHQERGSHWLDFLPSKRLDRFEVRGIGLAQLCTCFETVELWIGPTANDQLELIWLLDYLKRRRAIPSHLFLRGADPLGGRSTDELAAMDAPRIAIASEHVDLASKAWQAYRSPTPQAWCDLLREDLSGLPRLRDAVLRLLVELPAPGTGLGSTEMGLLELIYPDPPQRLSVILNTLVYFNGYYRHTIFNDWETALLAEPLAFGPEPAITALDPELQTVPLGNLRRRQEIHRENRPRLTEFGEAVLLGNADFSEHNPIHRWWGGTELTNAHLWRWDPVANVLIEP
ncbi:conserved hypothetical protein [Bradyrhizobium sp. STM 3843]|uniref:hypothetical protein n=1 Tax=Bradyrhizobium sp. STM 3843 TaxID=551947 RepID=UPI0002403D0D|nr:hypothetical protein [Bradyrhizobium sp. STM 3843]CCE09124.1 conserved hypothetical protein [Bradyrhizobium sp. STM 3843]